MSEALHHRKRLMTEVEEMIAEARQWPREPYGEGLLINRLADEIERLDADLAGMQPELEHLRAYQRQMNEILKENAKQDQEIQRLQQALNFWLPCIPEGTPADENPVLTRIGRDAMLLVGYDGEPEPDAAQLGWIRLQLHPSEKQEPRIPAQSATDIQLQGCRLHKRRDCKFC